MQNIEAGKGEVELEFGDEIRELLKRHLESIPVLRRGFVVPSSIPDNSLLFIGINPSFSREQEPSKPQEYFYEHTQESGHKYFNKFALLGRELKYLWSHWDLLLARETKQTLVQEIVNKKDGVNFVVENLELSKRILESTRPLAIIVNNTLARTYLGKDKCKGTNIWMGYDFKWDDEIGTYRISTKGSKLQGKCVFFTSMLTGQRALDNGSFERLKWQIKRLGIMEKWPKQNI